MVTKAETVANVHNDSHANKRSLWAANKWLFLRRLSQLFILCLFLIGPWYGVWIIKGNLSGSLLLETVPMTDPLLAVQILAASGSLAGTALIGTLLVAGFYALVGGRVFCSWVCPINPVTDLANWLRRKLRLRGGAKLTRSLRYWVLAMVLVTSALTGSIVWEYANPVSILHRELFFGLGLGWTVILGIFLFDLIVADRGWCSHICPMGALYGLVGSYSPLRIRSEKDKCDDCGDCYYVCPEPQVITPTLKGNDVTILAKECTNCGRCIDRCPQDVFHFGLRRSKP
jgi:ferredoxin-type protein NapH